MVCAVADIALGQNVFLALTKNGAFENIQGSDAPGPTITTVSMSTDFAGSARIGDWIEAHVDVQRAGKQMAFANAYLVCNGQRIARISGVYKIISK